MEEEYGVTYANLKFNQGNNYANALYTYTRVTDRQYNSNKNKKCMVIQVFSRDGDKKPNDFKKCINYSGNQFYGIELCETNQHNEFAYFYTNNQQNEIIFGFLNSDLNVKRSNSGAINASSQIEHIKARYGGNYIYVAYQGGLYLNIAIIYLDGSTTYNIVHSFEIPIHIWENQFTIQAYKNGKAIAFSIKGQQLYITKIKPDGTYDISRSYDQLYSTITVVNNRLKNNSEFVDDSGLISVTITGYQNKIEIFTYDMDGNEICFNSQTVSSYNFNYASFTLGSRYEMYIIAKYSDGISRIIKANPMTCAVSTPNYQTNLRYTFGFLFTQSNKQQKMMLFGQNDDGNYYKIYVATVQSCTDYYTSSCSSCSGSNKSPSNGCRCSTGYFETSFTSCSECTTALRDDLRCKPNQCYSSSLSLCKECIGDQDQEYSRFLGTCGCPIGYYDDFPNNENCQTCNIRCDHQGCDSATNCFKCVGVQGQVNSRIPNQSCECPDGFWDDSSKLNCQSCNYKCGSKGCTTEFVCKNCIGTSGQSHSRVMDDCKCPVGYYDDYLNNSSKEDCIACNIRCGDQGCDSQTNCLNCVGVQGQANSRIPNDSCRCPDGFWNDPTKEDCQPCDYRCGNSGCITEFDCKNCLGTSGQLYSRIMNDCLCPIGYYDNFPNNNDDENCQACDYRCGDQGCNSNVQCINCIGSNGQSSSRYLDQCLCPVGYYDDWINNNDECQSCNKRCDSSGCDSATNCFGCVGIQNQVNSRIKTEACRCPDGFWDDPNELDCQPCDYRCGLSGCISEFVCKNCIGDTGQTYSRILDNCHCPVTYYDDFQNNNSNENCLSCNSRCGSLGCDSAINCLNCVGIQNVEYSRIPSQTCICPDGFWDDPAILDCQPCDYRCGNQGCVTQFDCKNCIGSTGQPYSRIMNDCICPIGFYDDYQNNNAHKDCLSCNYRCGDQGCDSATNCFNCVGIQNAGHSRIPNDTCKCPDGFWDDSNELDCQSCNYRCGSQGCISELVCKNCIGTSGQSHSRVMSDCHCPVGYYDDYLNNNANEDCLSCNIRCGDLGCDSATNCSNCVGVQGQVNSRIPNDSCRCPDGFWDDPTKEDCQPCDYRCGSLGCITEFDCKDCIGTTGQLYSRIISNCNCPVGYYDDYLNNNDNEDCLPCDYKCGNMGCTSAVDCVNCIGSTGQFSSRELASCECPVGYYDDWNNTNNDECQKCDERCGDLGCLSDDKCINCAGSQNRQYSKKGDLCDVCNNGFYNDYPKYIDCQKCPYNCGDYGCKDKNTCNGCREGYSMMSNQCVVCPPIYRIQFEDRFMHQIWQQIQKQSIRGA
ncbi:Insulin-like growth factor binding protein, N-terminal [Pseudocohnilembus persalinus]|uniref:Insulin-like growth factor binding protein, N-terminal n=1 Tax=Pseudocohnilembus persalinus TaxID=266149 RepID=A0A0V0QKH7_PSEPJ|nr:Insulin-like growth factor binding protein, N-terminal [Pseudocohnilembus persalinus]|eukprot:KRX02692.1 Insulin-like growth factor binding protein, N-terminal [Pseudocohnilembus persalinus]